MGRSEQIRIRTFSDGLLFSFHDLHSNFYPIIAPETKSPSNIVVIDISDSQPPAHLQASEQSGSKQNQLSS
ncbi:hypothetical Protein YC6258_00778 [Gynuella sunshinyii YC6258]|uniref:Uncharacterized protein n=1 Tax=Gynuella sunshinyii YC6258 TaxID=1445510 RepID=A0A0C5VHL5_9GAMM|nr:hypothetical Protein YC6258_00778 [Gynuella sunshinyii YC6258]